jgi:hypothetical protein
MSKRQASCPTLADVRWTISVANLKAWPNYVFGSSVGLPTIPDDNRKVPSGIHALFGESTGQSLGLLDDVTDGIINCSIGAKTASARIAVGPPDFQPGRRHPVSIQDGLVDRIDRAAIRPAFPWPNSMSS